MNIYIIHHFNISIPSCIILRPIILDHFHNKDIKIGQPDQIAISGYQGYKIGQNGSRIYLPPRLRNLHFAEFQYFRGVEEAAYTRDDFYYTA
jgi:hypothetical protein